MDNAYQNLGKKVFWLFFLQMSPGALILLIASIAVFILSFQPVLLNLQSYAQLASLALFIVSVIIFAGAFLISWLEYTNYTFFVAEDSFKIKRGILSKTENAIPYRQIQNVDVERGILFQLLGLSRLIILTAGHEDEKSEDGDEAEGVIPAIDKTLGVWLQTELLKRADIQKTIQANNQ